MRKSPLAFLSALLMVPSGLCFPHAHSGLERRAETAPKDACTTNAIKENTTFWVSKDGRASGLDGIASLSVQVHVETDLYKGYFILYVDLGNEDFWSGNARLGLKDKTDVDINPYWGSGANSDGKTGTTTFAVWINSDAHKTPNYAQDSVEYDWTGMWPRFDMVINTAANADYYVVHWLNPAQGVTYLAFENGTNFLCATA